MERFKTKLNQDGDCAEVESLKSDDSTDKISIDTGMFSEDKLAVICDFSHFSTIDDYNNVEIDILGVTYTMQVKSRDEDDYLTENMAYCDTSSKEIVISKLADNEYNLKNINDLYNTTIRHEIIHAFLHESGLNSCCDFGTYNEPMVDYFALQIPKMVKLFKKINIL